MIPFIGQRVNIVERVDDCLLSRVGLIYTITSNNMLFVHGTDKRGYFDIVVPFNDASDYVTGEKIEF